MCDAACSTLIPCSARCSASAMRRSRSGRFQIVYCMRVLAWWVTRYPSLRISASISSSIVVISEPLVLPSPSQQPNVYGATGSSCSGYSSGPHRATEWLSRPPLCRSDAAISCVVMGSASILRIWLPPADAATRSESARYAR